MLLFFIFITSFALTSGTIKLIMAVPVLRERLNPWHTKPQYGIEYFALEKSTGSKYVGYSTAVRYVPRPKDHPEATLERTSGYNSGTYQWEWPVEEWKWMQWTPGVFGSEEKAVKAFKRSALFAAEPFIEFRPLTVREGVLKSTKALQEEQERVKRKTAYTTAYIEHLEKELES